MNNTAQLKHWAWTTLKEAAWAPLCVVGLYGLALISRLYLLYPNLDIPTHILGGMAITYLYRVAIRNSQAALGTTPVLIQILLAFTAAMTTAVLWEFYENILDYFFHTHNVLGLFDTLKDLFDGLLGALVLSVLYQKK